MWWVSSPLVLSLSKDEEGVARASARLGGPRSSCHSERSEESLTASVMALVLTVPADGP